MKLSDRKTRFILNTVLSLTVSVALLGALALTVSAQTTPPIPSDYGLTATAEGAGLPVGEADPIEIAAMVVNILLGFLGAILVILVIYAGFLWMTAAGEEQKISKAKKLLGNAIVGLVIILASYAIASFTVDSLLEGTTNNTGGNNQACVPPPPPCPPGHIPQCIIVGWSCVPSP